MCCFPVLKFVIMVMGEEEVDAIYVLFSCVEVCNNGDHVAGYDIVLINLFRH